MREPETYCLSPDLHAWMRNGVMIESRGGKGGRRGRGTEDDGSQQAERVRALLSLGAYDIEQQRQSIRSNIQQAPAQWIVARGRRGASVIARGKGASGGCARDQKPRMQDPPG